MNTKLVRSFEQGATLKDLLTAIRQHTINPRADYVVTVVGKTACQA